jgi:hypothetical protein
MNKNGKRQSVDRSVQEVVGHDRFMRFYKFVRIANYGTNLKSVYLQVFNQSFEIAHELSLAEAKWHRRMLAIALAKLFDDMSNPTGHILRSNNCAPGCSVSNGSEKA